MSRLKISKKSIFRHILYKIWSVRGKARPGLGSVEISSFGEIISLSQFELQKDVITVPDRSSLNAEALLVAQGLSDNTVWFVCFIHS